MGEVYKHILPLYTCKRQRCGHDNDSETSLSQIQLIMKAEDVYVQQFHIQIDFKILQT